MKKVLFVTSEAHPLIKTGGLADVSGSLPRALAELGQEMRLLLPNYQALESKEPVRYLCRIDLDGVTVEILESRLPDSEVSVWLVDYPEYFGKPGNPYLDAQGKPWIDSAERFTLFCRTAVEIAMGRSELDWQADIVHCNDWQSGLVPALLSIEDNPPATVFTIHNMAYQGLFPRSKFVSLNLPPQLWNPDGLEFYDMLSFIKGGIAYADRITTVSPTYALEIQTPEFGCGLEGLLSHRREDLIGIINGIDQDYWNPETDEYIPQQYKSTTLKKKSLNKASLQRRFALPVDEEIPVIALISRLVQQKGIDLVIDSLPHLATMPLQFIVLGSGDKSYERRLENLARLYPGKIAISLGYNEKLSHLIEAGADIFFMPSRFEPCGLNQMYSQRYGTVPIVRRTGGLADTVVDSLPHSIEEQSATGIVFNEPAADSLLEATKRAILLFQDKRSWKTIQQTGMHRDFSWQNSAVQYLKIYQQLRPAASTAQSKTETPASA